MTNKLKQTEVELQKRGYHVELDSKAIDLVCGMEIANAECMSRHLGDIYYFCSKGCKDHFDANPEMYIG